MNIAIDIRNIGSNRTGSEVVVLQLVKHLVCKDPSNQYFLLTNTKDEEVLDYINRALNLHDKENVKIVCLYSPHRFFWLFFNVATFVRRHAIDVFHTEYIVPFFIPAHVVVLTHIHDVSFAEPTIRPLIGAKDLLILDLLISRSLARATGVIVVSKYTRDQLTRYYNLDTSKVHMIYNASGYDLESTLGHKERAVKIRSKYLLPNHYIFAIGTMQPRKNIPFLIESFARIAHKIPEIDLVLSGPRGHNFDKVIEATIERYPEISGRVHFTGYIEPCDLQGVYQGALCSAHPSLYEGFGLPLLESFWADIPVVASDIPVYREIAQKAALFFDPREIDRCSEVLYTVCTDKLVRAELKRQAEKQRQKFSWDDSADSFMRLYALDADG